MSEQVRASRRKYHIIYKTTCLVTGRYYIGMHSTDDLEDKYLGSGVRLLRSVKKYGKGQHVREILEVLPSRDAASNREKEILTEKLRADPMCLNCGAGGLGAVDRPAMQEETRKKISDSVKAHHQSEAGKITKQRLSEYHTGKKRPPEVGAKISARCKDRVYLPHTEQHKENIARALAGKPKPASTVEKMKAACTGRRKIVREDGTWYWGRIST